MPSETADPRNDLGDIKIKLENALIGVRIAEKMALDAGAALDRLYATLARPPAPVANPAFDDRLAVSHAEAGRILSRNRQTIWRWIRAGKLDVTDDNQVTMQSLRRAAQPKAKDGGR